MKITDLITPDKVILDIRGATKPEVLAELAGRASLSTRIDRLTIFRALLDGEAQRFAGLGLGAAMPHAHFQSLRKTLALFARLTQPVEFHALDGRPVDLIILLLGPEPATPAYLNLLLWASRALRDPTIRQRLRDGPDLESILRVLREDVALAAP